MTEPRVSLLASDSGVTFSSVGLVVIRESRELFERVLSQPPSGSARDFEVVMTFEHEVVHFIQALTN
jgi:hypothetical protein